VAKPKKEWVRPKSSYSLNSTSLRKSGYNLTASSNLMNHLRQNLYTKVGPSVTPTRGLRIQGTKRSGSTSSFIKMNKAVGMQGKVARAPVDVVDPVYLNERDPIQAAIKLRLKNKNIREAVPELRNQRKPVFFFDLKYKGEAPKSPLKSSKDLKKSVQQMKQSLPPQVLNQGQAM